MKVVLYARVSTEKQAKKDLSIPEQIRRMEQFCAQKNYEIVKTYKEEGASARDDRRPVFRKMIYQLLSGKRKVDAIVVYARSRFFRDVFGAKYYEHRLEKKGIQVISATLLTESLDAWKW